MEASWSSKPVEGSECKSQTHKKPSDLNQDSSAPLTSILVLGHPALWGDSVWGKKPRWAQNPSAVLLGTLQGTSGLEPRQAVSCQDTGAEGAQMGLSGQGKRWRWSWRSRPVTSCEEVCQNQGRILSEQPGVQQVQEPVPADPSPDVTCSSAAAVSG